MPESKETFKHIEVSKEHLQTLQAENQDTFEFMQNLILNNKIDFSKLEKEYINGKERLQRHIGILKNIIEDQHADELQRLLNEIETQRYKQEKKLEDMIDTLVSSDIQKIFDAIIYSMEHEDSNWEEGEKKLAQSIKDIYVKQIKSQIPILKDKLKIRTLTEADIKDVAKTIRKAKNEIQTKWNRMLDLGDDYINSEWYDDTHLRNKASKAIANLNIQTDGLVLQFALFQKEEAQNRNDTSALKKAETLIVSEAISVLGDAKKGHIADTLKHVNDTTNNVFESETNKERLIASSAFIHTTLSESQKIIAKNNPEQVLYVWELAKLRGSYDAYITLLYGIGDEGNISYEAAADVFFGPEQIKTSQKRWAEAIHHLAQSFATNPSGFLEFMSKKYTDIDKNQYQSTEVQSAYHHFSMVAGHSAFELLKNYQKSGLEPRNQIDDWYYQLANILTGRGTYNIDNRYKNPDLATQVLSYGILNSKNTISKLQDNGLEFMDDILNPSEVIGKFKQKYTYDKALLEHLGMQAINKSLPDSYSKLDIQEKSYISTLDAILQNKNGKYDTTVEQLDTLHTTIDQEKWAERLQIQAAKIEKSIQEKYPQIQIGEDKTVADVFDQMIENPEMDTNQIKDILHSIENNFTKIDYTASTESVEAFFKEKEKLVEANKAIANNINDGQKSVRIGFQKALEIEYTQFMDDLETYLDEKWGISSISAKEDLWMTTNEKYDEMIELLYDITGYGTFNLSDNTINTTTKWTISLGSSIAVAVATAALIISTGGTAIPVLLAAGAASGATATATNRIVTGEGGSLGDFATDVGIGTAFGTVTAWFGSSISAMRSAGQTALREVGKENIKRTSREFLQEIGRQNTRQALKESYKEGGRKAMTEVAKQRVMHDLMLKYAPRKFLELAATKPKTFVALMLTLDTSALSVTEVYAREELLGNGFDIREDFGQITHMITLGSLFSLLGFTPRYFKQIGDKMNIKKQDLKKQESHTKHIQETYKNIDEGISLTEKINLRLVEKDGKTMYSVQELENSSTIKIDDISTLLTKEDVSSILTIWDKQPIKIDKIQIGFKDGEYIVQKGVPDGISHVSIKKYTPEEFITYLENEPQFQTKIIESIDNEIILANGKILQKNSGEYTLKEVKENTYSPNAFHSYLQENTPMKDALLNHALLDIFNIDTVMNSAIRPEIARIRRHWRKILPEQNIKIGETEYIAYISRNGEFVIKNLDWKTLNNIASPTKKKIFSEFIRLHKEAATPHISRFSEAIDNLVMPNPDKRLFATNRQRTFNNGALEGIYNFTIGDALREVKAALKFLQKQGYKLIGKDASRIKIDFPEATSSRLIYTTILVGLYIGQKGGPDNIDTTDAPNILQNIFAPAFSGTMELAKWTFRSNIESEKSSNNETIVNEPTPKNNQ